MQTVQEVIFDSFKKHHYQKNQGMDRPALKLICCVTFVQEFYSDMNKKLQLCNICYKNVKYVKLLLTKSNWLGKNIKSMQTFSVTFILLVENFEYWEYPALFQPSGQPIASRHVKCLTRQAVFWLPLDHYKMGAHMPSPLQLLCAQHLKLPLTLCIEVLEVTRGRINSWRCLAVEVATAVRAAAAAVAAGMFDT
jgi:hypothetical protein